MGLKHSQARRIGMIRDSQRLVYNWAIERLLADPTLTAYDLSKEFAKMRRSTEHLRRDLTIVSDKFAKFGIRLPVEWTDRLRSPTLPPDPHDAGNEGQGGEGVSAGA